MKEIGNFIILSISHLIMLSVTRIQNKSYQKDNQFK